MTVTNCTITGYLAVPQSDWADLDSDSDLTPLTGTVSLRPVTEDRKPLAVAPDYDPPAVFAQPVMAFTGYVEDGVLKTSKGGAVGLRVPANDEVLGLERIWYRIDFDLATSVGQKVKIDPQYFEAPSTDTTVDLSGIMTSTGMSVTGVVRQAGYAEDIIDSGSAGRDIVRAVSEGDFWEAVSSVTSVKTAAYSAASGDIVPCDASGGGFTVYLPSAPDDGTTIAVKKVDSSSNAVLVQRSGTDCFNVANTGPSVLQMALPSQTVTLRYNGGVWYVIGNSYGPASLDALFTKRNVAELYDALGQRIVEFSQTPGGAGGEGNFPPVVTYLGVTNHYNSVSRVDLEAKSSGSNAAVSLRVITQGSNGAFQVSGPFPAIEPKSSTGAADASLILRPDGVGSVFVGPNAGGTRPSYLELRPGASGADARIFSWGTAGQAIGLNIVTQNGATVKANGVAVELTSAKSQPNGYAALDAGGKIPVGQLPTSAMTFLGVWDASTNTPTLTNGVGDAGDVYRVSVAGTRNLGAGSVDYNVGDLVLYDGSVWQRSDSTDAVLTVNGYSGVVTLTKSDIGLGNADNTSDVDKPISTATATALSGKEPTITAGTTAQYWRGDKSWQTLDKSAVGLGNVDNTSDATKPVSTATQTALNLKANNASPALSGTVAVASSGTVNVFNTADQTVNFERATLRYSSNVFEVGTFYAGSGTTARAARFGVTVSAGGTTLARAIQVNTSNSASTPFVDFVVGATSATGLLSGVSATTSCTASSGHQSVMTVSPTINQLSTAGYTALLINPTETQTGSGAKLLIDAAVTGVSRFKVDNSGTVTLADGANLVAGSSTGTKIATATGQKLAFWGVTPVAQPAAVADATDAATVITQLNELLSRLRAIGLIAT